MNEHLLVMFLVALFGLLSVAGVVALGFMAWQSHRLTRAVAAMVYQEHEKTRALIARPPA